MISDHVILVTKENFYLLSVTECSWGNIEDPIAGSYSPKTVIHIKAKKAENTAQDNPLTQSNRSNTVVTKATDRPQGINTGERSNS